MILAKWAGIIPILFLGACAHTAGPETPAAPPTVIHVPVPVSCVQPDLPRAPTYPDTKEALKAAPDFAARDQLLRAGWGLRDSRLSILEKQVDACR